MATTNPVTSAEQTVEKDVSSVEATVKTDITKVEADLKKTYPLSVTVVTGLIALVVGALFGHLL